MNPIPSGSPAAGPSERGFVAPARDLAAAALLFFSASAAGGLHPRTLSEPRARALAEKLDEGRRDGEPLKVLSAARALLRAFPDRPEYLQAEADALSLLGRPGAAAASWEEYLASAPRPTEACPALGKAYEAAGRLEKALDAHRRCMKLDPTNPDFGFYVGLADERLGREEDAEKAYLEVLSARPENTDSRIGLARLRQRQKRYSEADALLRAVLSTSPDNADALITAALVARDSGRRAEAKAYLRKAILHSPSYQDPYRILGRMQEQDGESADALRTWEALLSLAPEDRALQRKVELLRGGRRR
ncbi:MAG: tetratricopeptide repeat protein [Elusimicrobiota bacterium]|jgi:tetratricopeptide (TPR) repeat protein